MGGATTKRGCGSLSLCLFFPSHQVRPEGYDDWLRGLAARQTQRRGQLRRRRVGLLGVAVDEGAHDEDPLWVPVVRRRAERGAVPEDGDRRSPLLVHVFVRGPGGRPHAQLRAVLVHGVLVEVVVLRANGLPPLYPRHPAEPGLARAEAHGGRVLLGGDHGRQVEPAVRHALALQDRAAHVHGLAREHREVGPELLRRRLRSLHVLLHQRPYEILPLLRPLYRVHRRLAKPSALRRLNHRLGLLGADVKEHRAGILYGSLRGRVPRNRYIFDGPLPTHRFHHRYARCDVPPRPDGDDQHLHHGFCMFNVSRGFRLSGRHARQPNYENPSDRCSAPPAAAESSRSVGGRCGSSSGSDPPWSYL